MITLHDVQHLDLPELFGRGTRAFRRFAYDRAAGRADSSSSPVRSSASARSSGSSSTRSEVQSIHLGVDHDASDRSDLRERFLLYPARPWPHKNHTRLLEAFALLRREEPELRLVLTGTGTRSLAGPPGVEARDAVTLDELVSLYRRAACLVFPSRYEGFGLPPLEAMACGTPVAAARAGSIPEVCGDAAVLFDPEHPEAIAAGVTEALGRAPELGVLGLRQAAGFTWDRAAEAHESAYRAVAA